MYFELFLISLLIILLLLILCASLFLEKRQLVKEQDIVDQKIIYIHRRIEELGIFQEEVEKNTQDFLENANSKSKQYIKNIEKLTATKKETVLVLERKIKQLIIQQREEKQNLQDIIARKEQIESELKAIDNQYAIEEPEFAFTEEIEEDVGIIDNQHRIVKPELSFDDIGNIINNSNRAFRKLC